MATLTPSYRRALKPPSLEREDLATALKPWRRRVTLLQIIHWLVGSIILSLSLACLILLIARIVPWATAPYWATGIGAACPVIALCVALWYRPSMTRTASLVDRQLHLHDRMRTAWELREQPSILAGLQRSDALKQLQQYTPVASLPIRFRRSTPALMLVGSIVLALLIILPNPMIDYLRQQENLQAQIAKQISTIEQLRHSIDQQANLPQSQKQQIDQIIKDLEARLQNAKNENEAQQALADAQAKLDQLRDPQAANKIQAQNAAGQSLQNGQGQTTASTLKAIGQALVNNDSKALHQALQDLANQANQLNSQQRSQLAQDIAKAANEASQNPALSSALQQLSKAVADGSASEISDAVKAVEAVAKQTNNQQNLENALNKVSQGLQNTANNLASTTDKSNSNDQSQQGKLQNGPDQQGQNGKQSPGNPGRGRSGGHNEAGNKQGSHEQVYVPGQTGQGNSQQSIDNNTSVVEPGQRVSYQQVIEQYNQMAHNAIDNSSIAPDLKDLVHDYFNILEGQH